jgi:hypothetical protein
MSQKSATGPESSSERIVKDIRWANPERQSADSRLESYVGASRCWSNVIPKLRNRDSCYRTLWADDRIVNLSHIKDLGGHYKPAATA